MSNFPEIWPPDYLAVIQKATEDNPFLSPSLLNERQEQFADRIAHLLVPQVFYSGDQLIYIIKGTDGAEDTQTTGLTRLALERQKDIFRHFATIPPTQYDIDGVLRPQRYVDLAKFQ
jgi:hypothetical protein